MPSKQTSLLGLYTVPADINAHFIDLAKLIEGVEKKLIKWVVPEEGGGGGLFYKRSAINFAEYARAELISGRAFKGLEGLSMITQNIKAGKGSDYNEKTGTSTKLPLYNRFKYQQLGMATGQAAAAIRPVKANKGWKVGIPQTARATRSPGPYKGGITSIYKYESILEHGRAKPYQPPRPWFGKTFVKWVNEKAPKLIKTPFMQEFINGLMQEVSGAGKVGVSTIKEVPGLASSSGLEKYTKFESGRELTGRFKKAGEITFMDAMGKEITLIYDTMAHFAKSEGSKWYNLSKAQKKWNFKMENWISSSADIL